MSAQSQIAARANWVTGYPFEPYGGGDGASLVLSGTAARVAIPGTEAGVVEAVNTAYVFNAGTVPLWFKVGDATVVAAVGGVPLPPWGLFTLSLFGINQPTPRYISGITQGSAGLLTVVAGWGI